MARFGVRRAVVLIACSGLLVCPVDRSGVATAADKSGVKPQVLSLPSGPGSIEGLGGAFEPQLNTGTSSYSVSIASPPGRAGHAPELALQYSSGKGNGHFGIGWDLPMLCIHRQFDKGIPRFGSGDVFVSSGGEELVPLADGSFRCENESGFMRFARVGDGWEIRERNGKRHLLGTVVGSRVGPNAATFDGTFRWCVEASDDTHGNRISYSYTKFGNAPGDLYLTEVRYNQAGAVYNSVTFEYETRVDAFSDFRPGYKVVTGLRGTRIRAWSQEQLIRQYELRYESTSAEVLDPKAAGAVAVNLSLLTKVLQLDASGANFLPPLRFGYTRLHTQDQNNPPTNPVLGPEDIDLNGDGVANGPGVRSIVDAPLNEIVGNADADFLDVDGDALPDVLTTTTADSAFYRNLGRGRFALGVPTPMGGLNLGVPLSAPDATLADLDGDGLADFVNKATVATQTQVVFHRNRGNGSWADGVALRNPPVFGFEGATVRLLDVNADQAIDVVRSINGSSWEVCLNGDDGDTDFPPYGNFPDPTGKDVDRNTAGVLEGSSWSCSTEIVPFAGDGFPQVQFGQSGSDVQLSDLNGDRLQDVVYLQATSSSQRVIMYWPSRGDGTFDTRVVMGVSGSPSGELALGEPLSTSTNDRLKLADVNGDGLSDVVKISDGSVRVWFNLGGDVVGTAVDYAGTPTYDSDSTKLRVADINGNGSADLVWINALGPVADRWQYLDFTPLGKPNQLALIDNGLGRRTSITYRSSTEYYLDAAATNPPNPWQRVSPTPTQVVSQISTSPSLDLEPPLGIDPPYVSDLAYRDAYYDGYEKEFRGFAFAKRFDRGDADAPTKVTRMAFLLGTPDDEDNDGDGLVDERAGAGELEEEPLKGRVLWQEATTEAGGLPIYDGAFAPDAETFSRSTNAWSIRALHAPNGGTQGIATLDPRDVGFAFNEAETQTIVERGNGTPETLTTLTAYDDFGNPIEQRQEGAASRAGDERFTFTEYITDTGRWIVDRPKTKRVTDAALVKVTESRFYYDGAAYVGLPLGQVGNQGDLVREEAWVEGSSYIERERKAYDAFGNVVGMLDPLGSPGGANGHFREVLWDPTFQTFPVRETVHIGAGKPALVMNATYHLGFGVMTSSTDFNGNLTTYEYDSFGRVTAIVKPDDTSSLPTMIYEYRMADPYRGVVLQYDRGGTMTAFAGAPTPSSVRTRSRENAGEPGTYDVVQYVDGMSRNLALVKEGETDFIVDKAVLFNGLGTVRDTFQPYTAGSAAFANPPGSQAKTIMRYDAKGREVVKVNPPDATGTTSQVTTIFGPLARSVFDELGNEMTYLNDGLEAAGDEGDTRLVEVQEVNNVGADPGRYITRYDYNPVDSLLHITDALNNLTTFAYDGLQRKTFVNHPDRGVMSYAYDVASNLTETLDAKGQRILYAYDGVNRMLTEDYLDEGLPVSFNRSPDVRYVYDAPSVNVDAGDGTYPTATMTKGLLAAVEDLSGQEHLSYDERGRILWTIKQVQDSPGAALRAYKTELEYDSLDRETAIVYPDNDRLTYTYNARRMLERINGGPSGAIISSVDYQPSGQFARVVYGDGVESVHTYDPRLRLTDLTTAPLSNQNAPLLSYRYTFDQASNISRVEDRRPAAVVPAGDPRRNTQSFQYDDLYRVTRVSYSFALPGAVTDDGSIDYSYDRLGNMLSQTSGMDHVENGLSVTNLGALSYGGAAGRSNRQGRAAGAPPGPHALTGAVAGPTARTYTYDDNGNMTTLDGKSLTWDFKDRLVASEDAQMRADYVYDYMDRRIAKRVRSKTIPPGAARPPPTTKTIYANQYFEIRDGEQPVKYVFNGDTRVARITGTLDTSRDRVQRVRLFAGWNLFAVVVSAGNAASQLGIGSNPNITAAYRWDAAAGTYQVLSSSDPLPVGSAVWIRTAAAANVQLVGSYTEPTGPVVIPAGSGLVGIPGFQGLSLGIALPQSVGGAWAYDAQIDAWRGYLTGASSFLSDAPPVVGPGEALFVTASSAGDLTLPNPADRIRYYHQDHLGSSDILSDADGQLQQAVSFYPFGLPRRSIMVGDPDRDPYLFSQKELDRESALGYFEARQLAVGLGRFLSVDPFLRHPEAVIPFRGEAREAAKDAQRLHVYAYARNNPIVYADSDGQVFNHLVGAAFGALVEVGVQLAQNGGDINKINVQSVVIAAVAGGVSSGLSAVKTLGVAGVVAGTAAVGGVAQVGKNIAQGKPAGDNVLNAMFWSGVGGGLGNAGGAKVQQAWSNREWTKATPWMQRMSAGGTVEQVAGPIRNNATALGAAAGNAVSSLTGSLSDASAALVSDEK